MKVFRSNPVIYAIRMGASAVLALTFIVGSQSFAGPSGGGRGTKDGSGGGNVRRSSRADLEDIIANWRSSFRYLSDEYLINHEIRVTQKPLKPALSKMSEAILGVPFFTITNRFEEYARDLKFEIHEECFDDGESKDASTEYVLNAPICLSESHLARFSKSALRTEVVPLVFHEIAHQFQFGEVEANGFQELAELYLEYRTAYLSAIRARFQCALASKTLTQAQKKEVKDSIGTFAPGYLMTKWPKVPQPYGLQIRTTCAAEATLTGENLRRIYEKYDGDVWTPLELKTLSKTEQDQLLDYEHYTNRKFTYLTLEKALREPALTGYSDCQVCKAQSLDPYYIMMLAGKGALEHIDQQVARIQDSIKID